MTDLHPAEATTRALLERADPATLRALRMIGPDPADLSRALALAEAVVPALRTGLAPWEEFVATLAAVWHRLDGETAAAYAQSLLPPARALASRDPWEWLAIQPPGPIAPRRIGPYEATAFLGRGGTGQAFLARDVETGRQVTLKLAAGTEALVTNWQGAAMPKEFLRIMAWGAVEETYGVQPWIAREPADETFADLMRRRHGRPLPLAESLAIFRLACSGVAALHDQHIHRWSAHARNVFRVGRRWALGDLGRCVIATSPDDPRFIRWMGLAGCSAPAQAAILTLCDQRAPWNSGDVAEFCPLDPERERRLRMDDCAMLGGLLCDLLGLNRWAVFAEALQSRPYCSGRYRLTGDRRRDAKLSAILNRAWRGDAGGGLLAANDGRGEQTTYSDARELRADVETVLAR